MRLPALFALLLLAGAAMSGLYGLQIFGDQDKAAGAWG